MYFFGRTFFLLFLAVSWHGVYACDNGVPCEEVPRVLVVSYDGGEKPECKELVKSAIEEVAQEHPARRRRLLAAVAEDLQLELPSKGSKEVQSLESQLRRLGADVETEREANELPSEEDDPLDSLRFRSQKAVLRTLLDIGSDIENGTAIDAFSLRYIVSPLLIHKVYKQTIETDRQRNARTAYSNGAGPITPALWSLEEKKRDVKLFDEDNVTLRKKVISESFLASARGAPQNEDVDSVTEITTKWLKFVTLEKVEFHTEDELERFRKEAQANPCVHFSDANESQEIPAPIIYESTDSFSRGGAYASSGNVAASRSSNPWKLPVTYDVHSILERQMRSPLPVSGVANETRKRSYVAPIWEEPHTPNDPYFDKQWNLKSIDAPYAWQLREERGAQFGYVRGNTTIAVLDTGFDIGGSELKNQLWKNKDEICDNGIDDDGNGYVDDCYGFNFQAKNTNLTEERVHGTAVATTILGETDNGVGLASVCPDCRLMALRIGIRSFNTASFAEGMNYALGLGIKIFNYSGNGQYSSAQMAAVTKAGEYDAVFVTAAGNQGCDLDSDQTCRASNGYPGIARLPHMLSVGASTVKGEIAYYSNVGEENVDLLAPSGIQVMYPNDQVFTMEGTSFSAPQVVGAVGLIRSMFPMLNSTDVVTSIRNTCWRDSTFAGLASCPGLLDVPAAVTAAGRIAVEKLGTCAF